MDVFWGCVLDLLGGGVYGVLVWCRGVVVCGLVCGCSQHGLRAVPNMVCGCSQRGLRAVPNTVCGRSQYGLRAFPNTVCGLFPTWSAGSSQYGLRLFPKRSAGSPNTVCGCSQYGLGLFPMWSAGSSQYDRSKRQTDDPQTNDSSSPAPRASKEGDRKRFEVSRATDQAMHLPPKAGDNTGTPRWSTT